MVVNQFFRRHHVIINGAFGQKQICNMNRCARWRLWNMRAVCGVSIHDDCSTYNL